MQVDVAQGYSLMWRDTTKMQERQPHPSRAGTAEENSEIYLGVA